MNNQFSKISEAHKMTNDREALVGATVVKIEGDLIYFSNGMIMDVNVFSMNLFSSEDISVENKKDLSIQRNIRIV